MLDIKSLLAELKRLVTDLAADLLARSEEVAEIDAGLRDAYTQIEQGGRTADAFEVWRDDYLDQVAVAWVLGCVFVRFMEDNGLVEECWLAGEGAALSAEGVDRRKLAEETHELYFREHPLESDREYLLHVFRTVGQIPACRDLFAEGKTPLWVLGPSGDMAMRLMAFWREFDGDNDGRLVRSFAVEDRDTRFLGDLYQDLSEQAKKKYALLQTPVFVEEFILDRTLTPAIDEFGLEGPDKKGLRMIDPTCGSGHFLLGAFARLFDLWSRRESNEIVAAQKALDGVWGVDVNPFAVAIARFRLIVAALQACGIRRLKQSPGWKLHLATGDSLLFGARWSRDGKKQDQLTFGTAEEHWAPEVYACEDRALVNEVLGQQYHVVVGNPPYITVKDKALNQAYRDRYPTCHRKYSLAVPFVERFFDLCWNDGAGRAGYVGQITANSFMKREFGKKLIEDYFARIDLTHVIDTSGAYIPGHGTPTVILFGRNRQPVGDTVRAVLGIKGEPSTPDDPSQGLVWQSVLSQIDITDISDAFTSTADVARTTFARHPWSMGGGGAAELKEQLEEVGETALANLVETIGFGAILGEDEVFGMPAEYQSRLAIEQIYIRPLIEGDHVRDWTLSWSTVAIFPYSDEIRLSSDEQLLRQLWPNRTLLANRPDFSKKTYAEAGRPHWEYHQIPTDRYRTPLSITFAEVATHNHFVLDRGGKVFKQTAPIIKLPEDATEDDHLALLGLLNSSTICFWMKQVSHQKQMMGGDGIRISSKAKVPFQFAGTRLLQMPLPEAFLDGPLRNRIRDLAEVIDKHAQAMIQLTATAAIRQGLAGGTAAIQRLFDEYQSSRAASRSAMVFAQEEIDFTAYVVFGLADESVLSNAIEWDGVAIDAGMRPFEIGQQSNVDDFPVPAEIPTDWPKPLIELWRSRLTTIQQSKSIQLIESDSYKRRWKGRQGLFNHTARQDELANACKDWLLDRLETPTYWPDPQTKAPRLHSVAQLAGKASGDADFLQVAALYRGRDDFDVTALLGELVEAESVPLLPVERYKATGLRHRVVWERTWDLQRREDAGEEVGAIKVPPKYKPADFQKPDYWRLRGKLDVPKERWVSYPNASTEADPTLLVGWAGWDHLQQAAALVAYYDERKREGWTAERLTPLLAGLDELLPWIHQWHPEIDPDFGETAGQSYETLLKADAQELGLTIEQIRAWTPPKRTAQRAQRKTKAAKK